MRNVRAELHTLPGAEGMTDEQLDRLSNIWEDVNERYPEDQDRRDAAYMAAAKFLLGAITLDEAGESRTAAREASLIASAAATQVAIMAAQDGVPVAQVARRSGIDRMWLLQQLGKR